MSSYWADECELTARKILRRGFLIDEMREMSSIALGEEQKTQVVLIISTGTYPIYSISYLEPGIREGLVDMAKDGLEGRMIIYGLGFQFKRREDVAHIINSRRTSGSSR
ncbi:uncharacterized protein GGS22DRAFT_199474 [Annulohypoxylon maeteangense]|uniref:uncharacterized protein n=1 Tax=Annulohypoxylon maeteangense TaxID=1927788 RepID=UPI0020089496|nr:uncharacterized protein GGS22DRAFT_199474 [Annulohypoxylon maeteangense]KAI0886126.1 hypothetical protein GGS22DRAFT_199474 [Annulohypoxylon maeteangense]